jgi:hypothetical protein
MAARGASERPMAKGVRVASTSHRSVGRAASPSSPRAAGQSGDMTAAPAETPPPDADAQPRKDG